MLHLCITRAGLATAASALLAFAAPAAAQAFDWIKLRHLDRRWAHAMVTDDARGCVVLFGGCFDSSSPFTIGPDGLVFDDTWEWRAGGWTQRNPEHAPAPRWNHAMAFDSARARTVLFGGNDRSSVFDDTWEWDGDDWHLLSPTHRPLGRYSHAMAFDVVRQQVLLFGGEAAGNAQLGDTWSWDGSDWIQLSPAHSPPARREHAMARDDVRRQIVLHGGQYFDDTWLWDGQDWTLHTPPHMPTLRAFHAMAYVPARQRVVATSGAWGTMEWDGNDWLQLNGLHPLRQLVEPAIACDPGSQGVVLFGGVPLLQGGSPYDAATHVWDGIDWMVAARLDPMWDGANLFAADPSREQVVMATSYSMVNQACDEVWTWDGWRWQQQANWPFPGLRGLAAAFDPGASEVLLFGGSWSGVYSYYDAFLSWDGAQFRQVPAAIRPQGRVRHGMAFDELRHRVVVMGGYGSAISPALPFLGDTWEWDGQQWSLRHSLGWFSGRVDHGMVFDPVRGQVVLYGGFALGTGSSADMMAWDGSTWTALNPAHSPGPLSAPCMATDPLRRRVVLLENYRTPPTPRGTWEWDGMDWTARPTAHAPGNQEAGPMVYDSARHRLMLRSTWRYGQELRAVARTVGTGCGGSQGAPLLTSSQPYLDQPGFALEVLQAPPNATVLFGFALATAQLPLGNGCTLLLQDPLLLPGGATNASGGARFVVPIPATDAVRGLTFHAQAAVADPQGPWFGWSFTGSRTLVLGD